MQMRVRTADGLVDASAKGQFAILPSKSRATVGLDQPPRDPGSDGLRRTLGVELEFESMAGAASVAFIGSDLRQSVSPGGRPVYAGGKVVLGSSAAAAP